MTATTPALGVAGASVSAPSVGNTLGFAQYVVGLVGAGRVERVSVEPNDVHVKVTDTLAAEALVHLLGLDDYGSAPYRCDYEADQYSEGRSNWSGKAGAVKVFVSAPLALGGLPARRPRNWPVSADAKAA